MQAELQWTYFDRRLLQAHQRGYKPIGRVAVDIARWGELVAGGVPLDWLSGFETDIEQTLNWLCPGFGRLVAWTTWELSNAGFYVAPKTDSKIRLKRADWHFDETVDVDTAGLIATILAVNWRMSKSRSAGDDDKLRALGKRLLAFTRTHPEFLEIAAVID